MKDFSVKRPKVTEKLLLSEIFEAAQHLSQAQRGISIGKLICLIRKQLGMSQRALARNAGVPQPTVSRLETEQLPPNEQTLRKLCDALSCDLVITAHPRESLDAIRQRQARIKAEQKIRYLRGTMSLENQEPDERLMEELIEQEIERLLHSSGGQLWENL